MLADITHGHTLLSDWLFLLAAVLFVLSGMIGATATEDKTHGSLIAAGFALLAIGWLVL